MSQQIINIPVNWDDEAIKRAIEKGVIEEVKDKIEKEAFKKLGFDRYFEYSDLFKETVKECITELFEKNKEYIIKQVISSATKSLTSSKAFKEAKNNMIENAKLKEE